jgi:hypothetical protein
MSDARLVDPRPTTSPTGGGPASEPLPDDLALEAAGRLRVLCLVVIGLWVIGLIMNHLIAPYLGLPPDKVVPWPAVADLLALTCVALSLLVYRIAPRLARSGSRLFTVAIGYEVVVAFAIGVIN